MATMMATMKATMVGRIVLRRGLQQTKSLPCAQLLRCCSTKKGEDDKQPPANPWRHFQAFNGMSEYLETTLIQYTREEDDEEAPRDIKSSADEAAPKKHRVCGEKDSSETSR